MYIYKYSLPSLVTYEWGSNNNQNLSLTLNISFLSLCSIDHIHIYHKYYHKYIYISHSLFYNRSVLTRQYILFYFNDCSRRLWHEIWEFPFPYIVDHRKRILLWVHLNLKTSREPNTHQMLTKEEKETNKPRRLM